MKKTIEARLAQLKARSKKLGDNHNKIHALHFPKDGSKGVYAKYEDARSEYFESIREEYDRLRSVGLSDKAEDMWDEAPQGYRDSPEDKRIGKSLRILNEVDREIYACKAYLLMLEERYGLNHSERGNVIDIIRKLKD